MKLSSNDKIKMIAAELGIESWSIQDLYDTSVVYTLNDSGQTYEASYSMLDGKITLGMPTKVMSQTNYIPVSISAFALDGDVEIVNNTVAWKGKIFEIGDYPDKEFSLSAEEADAAIQEFAPVNNDIEHKNTILDGCLGQLQKVWRDGTSLFGEVNIPQWLNNLRDKEPIKVSLTWNRQNKRIIGNALTINPRVSDAQIQAAFTAASPTEKSVEEHKNMTLKEKLLALLAGKTPDTVSEDELKAAFTAEVITPPVVPPVVEPPAFSFDKASFDAMQADNAALTARLVGNEAVRFYETQLKANKCLPCEQEAIVAQFKLAVADDNAGKVAFTADGTLNEGIRVKALKAAFDARPAHNLTLEQLAVTNTTTILSAVGAEPKSVEMTDARIKELQDAGTIKFMK